MKNEKKITVALLIVYLLILSWIILFKLQFSFSALDHIRQINLFLLVVQLLQMEKLTSMKL